MGHEIAQSPSLPFLCLLFQVHHRHEVAAKIATTYGSRKATKVHGLAAAKAALSRAKAEAEEGNTEGWNRAFGVSTDADVALKWLQFQMKPQGKDPAVLRAEFAAVFPGATPLLLLLLLLLLLGRLQQLIVYASAA